MSYNYKLCPQSTILFILKTMRNIMKTEITTRKKELLALISATLFKAHSEFKQIQDAVGGGNLILLPFLTLAVNAAYANNSIINQDAVFTTDTTINITEASSENSTRYVGIEANDGNYSIQTDAVLSVVGNQASLNNASRLYGIASQIDSSLTLAGTTKINIDATSAEIRAIRVNGGDIFLDGETNISLLSDTALLIGVDIWSGATFEVSGDDFELRAKSKSGRIIGIQNWNSDGAIANLNSKNIKLHLDNSEGEALNQAVLAYQSTTNFNGNTYIEVIGGRNVAYGIDVQCDPNLPNDTIVNLNGSETTISVTSKGDSVVLRPSGATGYINVSSDTVNLSAKSAEGDAFGTRTQYGASLKFLNPNSNINISALSDNGNAFGMLNSTYGGTNTFQFGSTEIEAKSLNISAKGNSAFGINNQVGDAIHVVGEKDGMFIKANTTINTVSTSKDGISVAIFVNNEKNGDVQPTSTVLISDVVATSIAQNGGTAYAIYLENNGNLELGVSELFSISEQGNSIGIHNNDSNLKFTGSSVVRAKTALEGNGEVLVAREGSLILDGIVGSSWMGALNIQGKASIGLTPEEASAVLHSTRGSVLVVKAGTTLNGKTSVGGSASATSNDNNSLSLLSDGTLAIVATDDYTEGTPLVTVGAASTEDGSTVKLVNAVKIADGTTVFETSDGSAPSGYTVVTDNLLKVVENNQIVSQSAAVALGANVLTPNVINEALTASGPGAERIIALTTDTTAAQAVSALNNIALMGTASGAQTAAINAANIQLDVIESHGSVLADYAHGKSGADLWIDLNGSFSKANRFSAGSTTYGYKSDLAGVTIGSDYVFGRYYAAGVSVSFGTGSVRGQGNGVGIKNEVDYYGLNFYGVRSNEYFNMIGSVGYLQTKNEIKFQGYKGKPDVKVVSAGVRFEKPLSLTESITVTPHIGVRYKHIDMDSFSAGGFNYDSEKANLIEIPFGVAFNANLKAQGGAEVMPFTDLTIIPNFGDRKVENKVGLANNCASDSFDVRIANNLMYNAKFGLNAVKGNHSLGISYGIGSGSYGRIDQALQAKYRYNF